MERFKAKLRIFNGYRPRWSVATVLTLTMLGIISLFMSVTTLTEIRREKAIFRVHLEEMGLLYLNSVRHAYIHTGELEGPALGQLVGGTGRGTPDISHLDFFSVTGESLGPNVQTENGALSTPHHVTDDSVFTSGPVMRHVDGYLEVTAPIVSESRTLGFVHFRMSSSSVGSAIRYLAISALVQSIVMIAIAVPITYFVAQRFTRPIRKLARAAESVGAGSLDVEMPRSNWRNDEIGDLNSSFSSMVNALKESRRRLEQAQERNLQSAKMVAVDKLANGVAHEINNPLASILGFAQLGKQKLSKIEGETVRMEEISFLGRYLGFVETEARRCGQIISRMLSFTLSPEQQMTPTDVNQQVEQVIRMNINQLAQAGVTPELHLGEGLPRINAEHTSLICVFEHLLTNAIKAMPDGGVLRISTFEKPEPFDQALASVVVEIQDEGLGIPADNLSKVFDPFFTTAEPGRGTGLGLYVAYQIIKQHGADIVIASLEGEGVTVTMTFPVPLTLEGVDGTLAPVEWV